jgi:hypothetical protein
MMDVVASRVFFRLEKTPGSNKITTNKKNRQCQQYSFMNKCSQLLP